MHNELLFLNLTIAAAPSFSTRATAVGRAANPNEMLTIISKINNKKFFGSIRNYRDKVFVFRS
ncbi:hypothetical protein D7004_18370 [Pedobacter jejuensis]|uniref:Uncharacterized protein n=1 Tax=Pedobacter jejuensis TaxID=1268550 RepID=A0A3N0BPA8_9SPHI|nr:hypothetical protein D7004_18370 [Pedobacter jejuensis]